MISNNPFVWDALWRDGGGWYCSQGELDALSVSQCFKINGQLFCWSGAAGAKKDIKRAIDWLEQFETVVFMFDQDEVGQRAARECSSLLSPSKAKIAHLPLKDASEMFKKEEAKNLLMLFGMQKS